MQAGLTAMPRRRYTNQKKAEQSERLLKRQLPRRGQQPNMLRSGNQLIQVVGSCSCNSESSTSLELISSELISSESDDFSVDFLSADLFSQHFS